MASFGARVECRRRGRWIGLKCHVSRLDLQADLEMHLASNGYVGLAESKRARSMSAGFFDWIPKLSGKGAQTLERYLRAGGLDGLVARIFSANGSIWSSFLGVAGFRLGRPPERKGIAALGDAWG